MEKMDGKSLDIEKMNIEKIKELFPNCVSEGKINFDILKELLGDVVDESKERYQFTWNGKAQAIKNAQSSSSNTLRPCKEKSLNWETTKNIYIEGDNLEALKQLQKTYFGKIGVIYIDPPYNTGHDFVYKDNFNDSFKNYLEQTEQTNSSNPESSGRFHTDWLNMMYPRLVLAKNLMSDDGAIFISIDDHELANLKKICDEIIGENNFVCCIPRITSPQRPSQESYISVKHDYVLVYTKTKNYEFRRTIKRNLEGVKEDSIGKYFEGDTSPILASATQGYSEGGDYDFEYNGKIYKPIDKNGNRRRWLWVKERMEKAAELGILVETGSGGLRVQNYIDMEFEVGTNVMKEKDPNLIMASYDLMAPEYQNKNGSDEVKKYGLDFDFPKPVKLIKELIKLHNNKDAIVLDFFAGSATTAQAVIENNIEENDNKRFILVQLPEAVESDLKINGKNVETLCEISEERYKRYVESISNNLLNVELDTGVKVYKLDSTNIKPWDNTTIQDETNLLNYKEIFKEGRTKEDVLYEVMLKYGIFDQQATSEKINGKDMFRVGSRYMIVCLEDEITADDVKKIGELKPKVVVFKENGFANDNDKINAVYNLEKAGVEDIRCI